ncbi:MAG: hypothetical protein ACOVNZ_05125, partial [Crocinitomicaceae bacterium]
MVKKSLVFFIFILTINIINAQKERVNGFVKNEMNIGIPLVKVQIKGQNIGTTTDSDGFYEIEVTD